MSQAIDRFVAMDTFVRIVESGSLTAAAEQLGTSQPTVSRRLSALEKSLGVSLLQRSTHAIQITAAGRRYLMQARQLMDQWQRFEAELRGAEEEPEGLLRVVAPHAFGQQQLVLPVLDILRRHPKLTVEWRLHDGVPRMVEDGIDCVIRVGRVEQSALVARKIHELARVVVAAPDIAEPRRFTRPQQLAALPWLALGSYYRNSIHLENDKGASVTLRIQPRFVTDSLFALRTAVLGGLGVATISEWLVRDDIDAGRLVQLTPRWRSEPQPMWVLYPRAAHQPAKLRVFVDAMRTAFAPRAAA